MHHFADHRVALSTLTTIDPVLRDSALFGLLVDAPRTVALRHDIRGDDGMLRRVVLDATGVLEDVLVPLEHACLSCTVREDAIPQLRALAQDGRWDSIVLALPVAAEPLAVIRALTHETQRGGELDGLRIASTVTVVDVERAEADLLDDALVAERGIGLTDADDRSVGEVLSAQLEQADVVVVEGERRTAPTGSGLVERLRAAGSTRVEGVFALSAQDLAARRHHPHADERRAHPSGARAAQPLQADPGDASWTLELRSTLPFHPERLLDEIVRLGTGRLRSRGVFWVPNRPDSMCAWDGAGGQLHIGEIGPWHDTAHTRLVFVGVTAPGEPDPREDLRAAFATALTTEAEMADGGAQWLGRKDVLEPWLGARSEIG